MKKYHRETLPHSGEREARQHVHGGTHSVTSGKRKEHNKKTGFQGFRDSHHERLPDGGGGEARQHFHGGAGGVRREQRRHCAVDVV